MRDSQFLKVLVLGNSNVGKTCLMNKYVKSVFIHHTKNTVGADFSLKDVIIGQTNATLQIWDTVGQERYHSLCRSYYRGADCCVLVFDVTDRNSFEMLNYWHDQFLVNGAPKDVESFPFVLIGNKVDLPSREVSIVEAEELCRSSLHCPYYETSAKDGINVDFAFQRIAEIALGRTIEPRQDYAGDYVFPKKKNKFANFIKC